MALPKSVVGVLLAEVQSQYAKKAYEGHIAQMTKLGEMYISLAQKAFKPLAR